MTGEVVGLYETPYGRTLLILILDLSFLSALPKTQTPTIPTTANPTETPRNRLRRRGDPPFEETPSKRPRRQSPAAVPSLDEEAVIVSDTSSCTEGANEDDDQENQPKPRRQLRARQGKASREVRE